MTEITKKFYINEVKRVNQISDTQEKLKEIKKLGIKLAWNEGLEKPIEFLKNIGLEIEL